MNRVVAIVGVLAAKGLVMSCHRLERKPQVVEPPGPLVQEAPKPQSSPEGSIDTPFGKLAISAITYSLSTIYVSHIRAYSSEGSSDGQDIRINDSVYLIEAGARDNQLLHIALVDGTTYWINVNDLLPRDYYHLAQSTPPGNNYQADAQRQEAAIDLAKNGWERKGPYLKYKGGHKQDFFDSIELKGPFYNLIRIYSEGLALIHVQYYEGAAFKLFDMNNGRTVGPFLSEPFFSASGTSFATCGSYYAETPSAIIFTKDNGVFKESKVFILGPVDDTGIQLDKVQWQSETEVWISTKDGNGKTTKYNFSKADDGQWFMSQP